VEVVEIPPTEEAMKSFAPDFSKYDVIVMDFNTQMSWSEKTKKAFEDYVKSGGGLVIYHAADNGFTDWKEYNKMIGVGGWGGRDRSAGSYIRWRDGKMVVVDEPGPSGEHGPRHDFQIVDRDPDHPIMKGLPTKWMHAEDELYQCMRGPAENVTLLATAYADPKYDGSGENEPILMAISYGDGRVFHTTLGHAWEGMDELPAMECVGFITTFQRGTEWAATGEVTIPVPEDFPTADKVSRWEDFHPPTGAGSGSKSK
jgi:type 1 glutamine amidotransferase